MRKRRGGAPAAPPAGAGNKLKTAGAELQDVVAESAAQTEVENEKETKEAEDDVGATVATEAKEVTAQSKVETKLATEAAVPPPPPLPPPPPPPPPPPLLPPERAAPGAPHLAMPVKEASA